MLIAKELEVRDPSWVPSLTLGRAIIIKLLIEIIRSICILKLYLHTLPLRGCWSALQCRWQSKVTSYAHNMISGVTFQCLLYFFKVLYR